MIKELILAGVLSWTTDFREPGSTCQPMNEYICYPLAEREVLIPNGADTVAYCESKAHDWEISATGDHGRWQINWISHRGRVQGLGINTPEELREPLNNWRAMLDIYLEQGFGPWSCQP